MPLSAKVAVVMLDPGPRVDHCEVDNVYVEAINRRLALDAYGLVISQTEELLKSVVEFAEGRKKEFGFKWGGSKLKINWP